MNVGSFLEIYTTMFGWSVYNSMYTLFSSSGLLLVPFIFMLIKNWKEPMQSQNDKAASLVSLARVQFDSLAMIAVFMLAVVPTAGLDLNDLRYRTACTDSTSSLEVSTNVVGGSTGTTYDVQLGQINNVRMPVLWWLVTSVGSGVNVAMSSSFTCFEDMKGLDMQMRNLTIKDQSLRHEYMRFANECYLPSKSKFTDALKGGQHYQYVVNKTVPNFEASTLTGGSSPRHDDYYFIGSHYYLQTSGFYKASDWDTCESLEGGCGKRATHPVYNWPLDQTRDRYPDSTILEALNDPDKTLYGRPYCDQWWADSNLGLKNKLLDSIEAVERRYDPDPAFPNESWLDETYRVSVNALKNLANTATKFTFTREEFEDMIITRYVDQDPPSFLPDKGGVFGNNDFKNVSFNSDWQNAELSAGALATIGAGALAVKTGVASKVFKATASSAGGSASQSIALQLADFYTNMYIVKQAAPMVQAILLMLVYSLLLIYMVMTNYDIDATIQMIFIILGIQFFTTLWNFADYLDAQLFVSMFPDITWLGSLATMGPNRLILDVVLTLLYVVAPFILLWIMNMAGSKVSSAQSSLGSLGKTGQSNVASSGGRGGKSGFKEALKPDKE